MKKPSKTDETAGRESGRGVGVLVVDDDAVSREYIGSILTRQGFVTTCVDGVGAAQSLLTTKGVAGFECVVTDYLMPGQSGLDLLAWIKKTDPSLATILLTGQGQSSVITESLRGGAVDFLEKPVQPRELKEAVQKAVARTRHERHLARMASAVMGLAQAQRWMLHSSPTGDAASADLYFHPKLEAGGDFFSHVRLAPDQYCFLLTDVSGHDLQAAYVSAYFQGIVRGMLERETPVWKIFQFFNRFLIDDWKQEKSLRPQSATPDISLAASAVMVNFNDHTATALTSVHRGPGLYDDRRLCPASLGDSGGFPLGWFPELSVSALTYGIDDGGSILMWTDGLDDLANEQGVSPLALAYRWQRCKAAGQPLPMLDLSDDDVLLARIDLGRENQPKIFHPIVLEEYNAMHIGEVDTWMERWSRSLRLAIPHLTSAVEHDLCLAGREALLNALKHGCLQFPECPAMFQIGYRADSGLLRLWVQGPGGRSRAVSRTGLARKWR